MRATRESRRARLHAVQRRGPEMEGAGLIIGGNRDLLEARGQLLDDRAIAAKHQVFRQERPGYPRHFDWCPKCGRRYAAWEGWAPASAPR
jgi:hypothetical protein